MGREDVLPFWFGESDRPTPEFIRRAGASSIMDGETFYTQNLGRPYLREAVAEYLEGLHGRAYDAERIGITGSGVEALMLASQLIVDPGDRVVAVTPLWPNLVEIPRILGGEVERVPLEVRNGRWTLDIQRLLDALRPGTRALLLNSPNNPTGWTIDPEARDTILQHCRKLGIWIVADEVYERLVFSADRISAPSFVSASDPEDRVIGVNSFSKAWCMTGWRAGWMVLPDGMAGDLAKLIEYNTSCVPEFVQRAAAVALKEGEPFVSDLRTGLSDARSTLVSALKKLPDVDVPEADGAMYAFFRIEGHGDSLALAKQLIAEAGLGLAPGRAFGEEGEGWLRWCFAAEKSKLDEGIARISGFLGK